MAIKRGIGKNEEYWIFPSDSYGDIEPGKVKVESIVKREVALKVFPTYALECFDSEDDPIYNPTRFVSYIDEGNERWVIPYDVFLDHSEPV